MSRPWRIEKAIASLLGAAGTTDTSLRQAVFDRVRLGSDAALLQAIYVCFVMSTMDRMADAFAFELPDARILKRYAWIATTFGYKGLSLPG